MFNNHQKPGTMESWHSQGLILIMLQLPEWDGEESYLKMSVTEPGKRVLHKHINIQMTFCNFIPHWRLEATATISPEVDK